MNRAYRLPPKPSRIPGPESYRCISEASQRKRIDIKVFAEKLLQYDVISFDMFDTLILRPFKNPSDVFMLLSSKYNEINFSTIRELAEKEARMEQYEKNKTYEVNIYDIYKKMQRYINIDPVKAAEVEMNVERDICLSNPYMKQIYDILCEHNKEIIVTTNMYIPAAWIQSILEKCGYNHFSKIYVSCEYGVDKAGQGLFREAAKHISPTKKVIHIGDNYTADVDAAIKFGWSACHYPSVNFLGEPYRPKIVNIKKSGISPLVGSAYCGIVNKELHNGLKNKTDLYEYGFKYGGPYAIGFTTWIHDFCKEKNIDKILFLSRDGYTLKMVYDSLYHDIPCEYALWSRNSAARAGIKTFPFYFITSALLGRTDFLYNVKNQLQYFQVPELESKLSSYGLTPDALIGRNHMENNKKFTSLIIDHIEEVKKSLDNEVEAAKEYYSTVLKDCKKVVVVDTGWSSANISILQNAIEADWMPDCKVISIMAGMLPRYARVSPAQLLTNNLCIYMFSPQMNAYEMDFNRDTKYNPFFYELFSAAPHSSLRRFQKNKNGNLEFIFDSPEVENYWTFNQIREGMLDFVEEYKKVFQNYDFMYKISGSDVAMIIRSGFKNQDYLINTLGNLLYVEEQSQPSFSDEATPIRQLINKGVRV